MDKTPFTIYDFLAYLSAGACMVACIDLIFGYHLFARDKVNIIAAIYLIAAAYVLGHVVAHLSGWLFESGLVFQLLGRPADILLGSHNPPKWELRFFPGYSKPLPRERQHRIATKAISRNVDPSGDAFFMHAYAVVTGKHEIQQRLDQFRNQYSFARNMSLAALLSSLLLFATKFFTHRPIQMRWPIIAMLAGVALFYRYLKFFRQFSYELLIRYAEN